MELPPELKSPLLPNLSLDDLPDEERKQARTFLEHMRMLQRWSFDFSSSASLFDFASKPPSTDLKGQWCFIAARNGGMALRNYGVSLATARKILGELACWETSVDRHELDDVQHHFGKRFPGIERLRGDHGHDPRVTGAADESGGPLHPHARMQDCLFGHTYMSTSSGSTISYDLNFPNALFLLDLTKRAYGSLSDVCGQGGG